MLERVPVHRLIPHPANPRVSDIEPIKESLRVNGQYRPIVANKRTGHVLAGNHTLRAAIELGFEDILVYWVDVDEHAELKILLADNRTTEFGYMDPGRLVEALLQLGGDFEGTAYDPGFLDALLATVDGEIEVEELAQGESLTLDAPIAKAMALEVTHEDGTLLHELANELEDRGFDVRWLKHGT